MISISVSLIFLILFFALCIKNVYAEDDNHSLHASGINFIHNDEIHIENKAILTGQASVPTTQSSAKLIGQASVPTTQSSAKLIGQASVPSTRIEISYSDLSTTTIQPLGTSKLLSYPHNPQRVPIILEEEEGDSF